MLTHEKRIIASFIDIGIVFGLSLILYILLPQKLFDGTLMFFMSYLVIGFLYMYMCLSLSKTKTVGLFYMKLQLLSNKWEVPSKKVIVLRSLANGVLVLHLINILYMLLNKTTDSFFDKLADSVVIQDSDDFTKIK